MKLYTQIELLNNFPTADTNMNFTQRLRLGLKFDEVQFGLAMDLNEMGRNNFINTTNTGIFLRYEF